jgi:hypothetical protein
MFRIAALIAAVLLPISALATPITVHNTGVDGSDALVAASAQAAFWTLLTEPLGGTETIGSNTFRYHHPAYAADTATSAWVAPAASGNASASGDYVYQLLIDLTGLDPTTAVITGQFGTDNDGFIRLNGGPNAAVQGFAGFGTLTNFTLNSGFVAGLNSIQIGVDNGGNPTAFHALFFRADADPTNGGPGGSEVPEPASLLLLGSGAVGLIARRRRQRSQPQ